MFLVISPFLPSLSHLLVPPRDNCWALARLLSLESLVCVLATNMSSPAPAAPGLSLITKDLIIVSAVFPVLSAIAILLRFKARRVTRAGLKSDDWWILATWVREHGVSLPRILTARA